MCAPTMLDISQQNEAYQIKSKKKLVGIDKTL